MQYVYFCPSCNNLECHNSDNLNLECAECGKKLVSLKVDMDTWNDLSNDEMVSIIDKARNSGLKKPVFKPEPEPEDTDFEDYEIPKNKNKGKTHKKRNKLLIPLIILAAALVIGAVAVAVVLISKDGAIAAGEESSEETVKEVPKETVELTKDNFLKYFDLSITCGSKVQENMTRDFLGFYSYDFSSDMTVTIKARKPLQCENCYISIDPHIGEMTNYSVKDDAIDNIKLEDDGYYTNTKKIHMNGYPFGTFEFNVFPNKFEIKNVSGTITYDEGTYVKEDTATKQ